MLNSVCASTGPGEPEITGEIFQSKLAVRVACMGPNLAYGKGYVQNRDCNLDFTKPFIISQTPLSLTICMNCTQQTCFLQRKSKDLPELATSAQIKSKF